jgi:hypothetical protein
MPLSAFAQTLINIIGQLTVVSDNTCSSHIINRDSPRYLPRGSYISNITAHSQLLSVTENVALPP